LAASSGLTIPLQITLSEIKLSAFIILVFSRQKGLTLVFRNDPLESLKVSSTFDSIPFVRDYLQKEIEMQLRTLMMDELPAIIHRLSLRLWCPEHRAREEQETQQEEAKEEIRTDPFGSPPQDAVDSRGNVLDASEIASLSLDGGSEIHSLFSQKNLLRLATLNDSHRTLSLFTPSLRDTVFRAWAGPSERNESAGSTTPNTPGLIRTSSTLGSSSTTYTFSRGSDDGHTHMPSRPSLVNMHSATTGLSLGAGRHSRSQRKKKTRVVNLRKPRTTDDLVSESGDSETSSMAPVSEPAMAGTFISEEPEDNIIEPPHSPQKVRFQGRDLGESPRKSRPSLSSRPAINLNSKPMPEHAILDNTAEKSFSAPIHTHERRSSPSRASAALHPADKKSHPISATTSTPLSYTPIPTLSDTSSTARGILEQAWVLKMAGEIARYANDEKAANGGFWSSSSTDGREDSPPPAYQPKA
jgi:distribution and morphology protein 34